MNGAEIDTLTTRLVRFTDKGLTVIDAERLADNLVLRDRDCDDRRLCLECAYLKGAVGWRCDNWRTAGIATRAKDAQLPNETVTVLQRCAGFCMVTPVQLA
jgi:hypothetical protein